MQIKAMLALIMLLGISAYDKQGSPRKLAEKPNDKIRFKRIAVDKTRPGLKNTRLGSRSMPTCRSRFLLSTCAPSGHCSSGKLCMDTTRVFCCIPRVRECLTPLQLGFDCVVKAPVNWCTHNKDCGKRKCCPTGCDYNICV